MKPIVTTLDPEKARRLVGGGNPGLDGGKENAGKRQVFTLVPDEIDSDIVLHWIITGKDFANEGEIDDIPKIIIIYEGAGVFTIDGEDIPVKRGDVLWISVGSHHSIKTSDSQLQYIVVKGK
jgi:Mannose-6-phosphate isomerase